MRLQAGHILVLVLVVLLLFGASRLPDLARSMGQSLKIFKKELKELHDDEPGSRPVDGASTTRPADGTTATTTTRSSVEQPPQG